MVDDRWRPEPLLAGQIAARSPDIIGAYHKRLSDIGSPLTETVSWDHAALQAEQVVLDLAAALRTGSVPSNGIRPLSREIGLSRAAHKVHPAESLRAGRILFEAIVAIASEETEHDTETLRFVVVAVNRSIVSRIQEAATWYAGFLLNQVQRAHIDERRRIARGLHDEVGHGITVALRQLELFDLHRESEPARAEMSVATARQVIGSTWDALRDVTLELRLTEPLESLDTVLRALADSILATSTRIEVEVNGDETWAPPDVRDEGFLILREAVRNAVTHGEPSTVVVRVDIAPHELRGVVDDDGNGFDLSTSTVGAGLASMHERAQLIGGALKVMSSPGDGTRVEMIVPLPGMRDDSHY